MLFVQDCNTKVKYLVDSGAEYSILTPYAKDRKNLEANSKLRAANGSAINTYGERLINLNLGLHRKFSFPFIIADVGYNILGSDFLDEYDLLVDIRGKQLVDKVTNLSFVGSRLSGWRRFASGKSMRRLALGGFLINVFAKALDIVCVPLVSLEVVHSFHPIFGARKTRFEVG